MKYIKIKPGNSILQAAGQFHFFTKCGSIIGKNDFKHIKWFREHLAKDKEFMGIVLYSGEDTLPFGENMFAVPTASLWE